MSFNATLTWTPLVIQLTADCTPPITPAVVLAIIYIESKGNAGAINPHGEATGLMQIMPKESNPAVFGTRPTKAELLDPQTNITWGIRILQVCLRGNRTLEEGLYYYSGGQAWQDYDRYRRLYWRPFQKARLQITRVMRTEVNDG